MTPVANVVACCQLTDDGCDVPVGVNPSPRLGWLVHPSAKPHIPPAPRSVHLTTCGQHDPIRPFKTLALPFYAWRAWQKDLCHGDESWADDAREIWTAYRLQKTCLKRCSKDCGALLLLAHWQIGATLNSPIRYCALLLPRCPLLVDLLAPLWSHPAWITREMTLQCSSSSRGIGKIDCSLHCSARPVYEPQTLVAIDPPRVLA